MAVCYILKTGELIKKSSVSECRFNSRRGYLAEFVYNQLHYEVIDKIHTKKGGYKERAYGYFPREKYYAFLGGDIGFKEFKNSKIKFKKTELAGSTDKLEINTLKLKAPYNDFPTLETIQWEFDGDNSLSKLFNPNTGNIIYPSNADKYPGQATISSVAQDFFQANKTIVSNPLFSGNESDVIYYIAQAALSINTIDSKYFPLLNHSSLNVYKLQQRSYWKTSGGLFDPENTGEIYLFQKRLRNFKSILKHSIPQIQNTEPENMMLWLAFTLNVDTLKVIPIKERIYFLKQISMGYMLGETADILKWVMSVGRSDLAPSIVNEEEFAIRIVQSVSNNEATDFLDGLKERWFLSNRYVTTLFAQLYDKIDDRGIGAWNRGRFIHMLAELWVHSSYYPYKNSNFDNTKTDIKITEDTRAGQGTPAQLIDTQIVNETEYDDVSKPISLTVWSPSGKYNGKFSGVKDTEILYGGDQIKIEVQKFQDVGGIRPGVMSDYMNADYGIFQPITLRVVGPELDKFDYQIPDNSNKNALMPVFLMHYIEEKERTELTKTAVLLSMDLALTFTGIGNLAKLRHVGHIIHLGKELFKKGALSTSNRLVAWELAQGAAGLIEMTSSIGLIYMDYIEDFEGKYCDPSSPNYNPDNLDLTDPVQGPINLQILKDKCEHRRKIFSFLMIAGLSAGGVDFLARKQLGKSARNILDGGIHPDFTNTAALKILEDFGGDFLDARTAFLDKLGGHPHLDYVIRNTLPDTDFFYLTNQQKWDLIDDFIDADATVLGKLNFNQGELVNVWKGTKLHVASRRYIQFLEDVRDFSKPHVKNKLLSGNRGTKVVNGNTEVSWGGAHLEQYFTAPLNPNGVRTLIVAVDDLGNPITPIIKTKVIGNRTYKQVPGNKSGRAKYIDGPSSNPHHTKRSKHTYVAGMTDSEFIEECAYARLTCENLNGRVDGQGWMKQYNSKWSDGTDVSLIIFDEIIVDGVLRKNHLRTVIIKPEW